MELVCIFKEIVVDGVQIDSALKEVSYNVDMRVLTRSFDDNELIDTLA